MKNANERAKYDDYEMLDNYDFADSVRGRFYEPKKIPTSMRLDNDILIFLKDKNQWKENSLPNAYLQSTSWIYAKRRIKKV